jgi:predicted metal-dependent hydrolase
MTDLTVRRLLIDLDTPFARQWNGGDAFRTAWFNALSMSFPVGEQFFIDSVREGVKVLPEAEREHSAAEVQGFIGQEATHRRIHALFNAQLEAQGHVNTWAPRSLVRMKRLDGLDPRHAVGATAATEHITAVFADWMLRHPQAVAGAEPRLQTLWMWHAAEESEHRSTAFDLYRAMGGNELWRLRFMRIVTTHFLVDVFRQTARNLRHDGELWKWRTWRGGWSFLFGREGLLRQIYRPWRAYFASDFHPRQQDAGLSEQWLREHGAQFAVVAR